MASLAIQQTQIQAIAPIEHTVLSYRSGKPHSSTQVIEYKTTSLGHVTIHQNLKQSMKMETFSTHTDLNLQKQGKKVVTLAMTLMMKTVTMMVGIQKALQSLLLKKNEFQARTLNKYELCTKFSKIAICSKILNSPLYSHKSSNKA